MSKRFILALVLAIAVALAATTAVARGDASLSLGQPDLQSGVLIVVPATVSCSPFDPSLTMVSSGFFVSVEQAVNKTTIAHGSGFAPSMDGNPILYPCDDVPHAVSVNVFADTGGAPFRKAQAVFTAEASAAAGTSCGPGCFFNFVFQRADLVTTLKLK
jgi:hypothetical protein